MVLINNNNNKKVPRSGASNLTWNLEGFFFFSVSIIHAMCGIRTAETLGTV